MADGVKKRGINRLASRRTRLSSILFSLLLQSGCNGGSGNPPSQEYSLNAAVSGLVGTNLVLALNGASQVIVNSNGTVQFPNPLTAGSTYVVSIVSQPASPAQTCALAGGTGTIQAESAATVSVTCSAPQYYSVGGAISGLLGYVTQSPLVLEINSSHLFVPSGESNQLTIQPGDSTFQFNASVAAGSNYTVTVEAQPTSPVQQCAVSNGSGTVASSNVTNVAVICAQPSGVTSPNAAITVLFKMGSNGSSDGAEVTSLIQGTDGNLYGTTYKGGISGCGTVFRVTLASAETILYSFAGGSNDGCNPTQLIQASDGNLYGITTAQGTPGISAVFKLTFAGVETVLHQFPTAPDASVGNPIVNSDGIVPAALIQGADGNLYGTTSNGGTSGYGIVFQLSTTGVEIVLHSFGGGPNDGRSGGGLAYGSDGNLYGVTAYGGANVGGLYGPGTGTFYSVEPFSGKEIVLATIAQSPEGIFLGRTGNFYVWGETLSDPGGSLFQITTAGAVNELATWCGGQFCADSGPSLGNFIQASDGNVYGVVSNYLGNFLAQVTTTLASPSSNIATYFSSGSARQLIFQGTNNIFFGTDGTNIFEITNVITPPP